MRPRSALLLLISCNLACGGKGTDPGSGSRTILATIEIRAEPGSSTNIDADLKLRETPVLGANVAFTDLDTGAKATLESRSAGKYSAVLAGYGRILKVKITAGDDSLEAQLEGPTPHMITRPPNDAIVLRRDFKDLRVEWKAASAAQRVEVQAEGIDPVVVDGNRFDATVPLSALMNREQKITVTRETSVDLAGGASGSKMRSRYKVDNRFTLE